MTIIFKKRRDKRYAYLSQLEGDKVRQRYIGGMENPNVAKLIRVRDNVASIPNWLSYLFWDTRIDNIDIKKHSRSIVTRILELGDMKAVEWMQMVYPGAKIVEILLTARNLSEKSRQFWMLWYGVDNDA